MSQGESWLASGVAIAFASLALAYALALPPYEGFDENAHYSYVSYLADRRAIPDFRTTPLDRASSETANHLPRPYSAVPPFEKNGATTYADFFHRMSDADRRKAADSYWQPSAAPAEYAPMDGSANWIGQHPPLYYGLMVLPYHVARGFSPVHRLLLLRLCSVALACGSLVFWWKSLRLLESASARRTLLLGGIAVLFFPSCWFDLGRMGNDSLVAMLSSALFFFLLVAYRNGHARVRDHLAVAVVLGLGLLTKAFFLPLYAGAIVWIAWSTVVQQKLPRTACLIRVAVAVIVPVAIALPWYWLCWHRYGWPLVTSETYQWSQPGAAKPGELLSTARFLFEMLKAMAVFVKSFLWSCTWSYVGQPLWHYVLATGLMLLAMGNIVRRGWRNSDSESRQIDFLAAVLLVPLLLNCVYYMVLKGRFDGFQSSIGGYYLFAVWAPLAVVLGRAFDGTGSRFGRCLTLAALVCVIYVELYGVWLSAQVFGGVVEKLGASRSGVGFLGPTPQNLALVHARLQWLAFPGLALLFYLLSWAVRLPLLCWLLAGNRRMACR